MKTSLIWFRSGPIGGKVFIFDEYGQMLFMDVDLNVARLISIPIKEEKNI